MKLTIKHNNCLPEFTPSTFVVGIPTHKDTLLNLINQHTNQLLVQIGVTYLHKKDQYNKQKGRELALSRIRNTVCTLDHIEHRGSTRWVFHFLAVVPDNRPGTLGNKLVEFGISIIKESDEPRLEYIIFAG